METVGWVYGPAISAFVAALLFALVDPVHEIFVILANDAVEFTSFQEGWVLRFSRVVLSVLGVYMMVSAIWHATRYLVINSPRGRKLYDLSPTFVGPVLVDKDLSWTPHILAVLPVLGLISGLFSTAISGETTSAENYALYGFVFLLFLLSLFILLSSTFRAERQKQNAFPLAFGITVGYLLAAYIGSYVVPVGSWRTILFLIGMGYFVYLSYTIVISLSGNGEAVKSSKVGTGVYGLCLFVGGVFYFLIGSTPEGVSRSEAFANALLERLDLFMVLFFGLSIVIGLLWISPSNLTNSNRKRKTGNGRRFAAAYLALTAAAVLVTIIHPPIWNVGGPLFVGCLFFGALAYNTAWLTVFSSRYLNGIPTNVAWLMVAFVLAPLGLTGDHRVVPVRSITPIASYQEAAETWLKAKEEDKGPIYLIAAQGGGLYAGYHAAYDLAVRSDLDPLFDRRVFAISSVSGGSVGTAAFWAIRRCKMSKTCKTEGTYRQLTRKILERDFLTPIAASLMFPDFLESFVPTLARWTNFERGIALRNSIASALQDETSDAVGHDFLGSIVGTTDGTDPLILINVTGLHSGQHLVFSPVSNMKNTLQGSAGERDISFGDAVVASARFPIVTPPSRVFFEHDELGPVQMIDGGYFDNSGLEGLRFALDGLLKAKKKLSNKRQILVIAYGLEGTDPTRRASYGLLTAPVIGLNSTRTARNDTTMKAFRERFKNEITFYECNIDTKDFNLTLSWLLSGRTFEIMREAIEDMGSNESVSGSCPSRN